MIGKPLGPGGRGTGVLVDINRQTTNRPSVDTHIDSVLNDEDVVAKEAIYRCGTSD